MSLRGSHIIEFLKDVLGSLDRIEPRQSECFELWNGLGRLFPALRPALLHRLRQPFSACRGETATFLLLSRRSDRRSDLSRSAGRYASLRPPLLHGFRQALPTGGCETATSPLGSGSLHENRSLPNTVSRFVLEQRYRSTNPISFALQFRNDSIEVQYLSPMGRKDP